MHKLIVCATLLSLIACLPGCWGKKQTTTDHTKVVELRISGPLADTDVVWTEEDFK